MRNLILLVDDDQLQAEVRRTILLRSGAEVVMAKGGEEALAILHDERVAPRVGLMVTDHWMPGMNGPQLVRETRRLLPGLPVLVLSGLQSAEEEYAEMPIVFRLKPCPPADLIRLVQRLLGDGLLRSA